VFPVMEAMAVKVPAGQGLHVAKEVAAMALLI